MPTLYCIALSTNENLTKTGQKLHFKGSPLQTISYIQYTAIMHCLTNSLHSFISFVLSLFLHWLELQDHWLEKIISFNKKFYWVGDFKQIWSEIAKEKWCTSQKINRTIFQLWWKLIRQSFSKIYILPQQSFQRDSFEINCKAFWKVKALALSFNVVKVSLDLPNQIKKIKNI